MLIEEVTGGNHGTTLQPMQGWNAGERSILFSTGWSMKLYIKIKGVSNQELEYISSCNSGIDDLGRSGEISKEIRCKSIWKCPGGAVDGH